MLNKLNERFKTSRNPEKSAFFAFYSRRCCFGSKIEVLKGRKLPNVLFSNILARKSAP